MTDLKTPYATRLCLSGAESRRLLDTFRDFGVKHIQVSYYYLKRVFSDPLEFAEYAAPFTTVLIDSGTIYHKFKTPQEKDDFIKDYGAYIGGLNKRSYTGAVYEGGSNLEELLPDEMLIYPLEDIRGVFDEDLDALCQNVKYIGLGKKVYNGGDDYMAQIFRAAEKHGSLIHCFGSGSKKLLTKWPWYSANSSNWRSGSRYLNTYIYEGVGRGLKLHQPTDKKNPERTEKELKSLRTRQQRLIDIRQSNIAPLIEWGEVYTGDAWEVDKANLAQWILFATDLENAPLKKYWLDKEDIQAINQRKLELIGKSLNDGILENSNNPNSGPPDIDRSNRRNIDAANIRGADKEDKEDNAVIEGEIVEADIVEDQGDLPTTDSEIYPLVPTTANTDLIPAENAGKSGRAYELDDRMRTLRQCDFCSLAGRCPKYSAGNNCAYGLGPETAPPDPDNLDHVIRTQMADNIALLHDSIMQLYMEEKADAAGASKDLTARIKLWADLVQQYKEATTSQDEVSIHAKGSGVMDLFRKR